MRASTLCVVLLVAGCGKPAAVPEKDGASDASKKAKDVRPSGPPIEYRGEYSIGSNPIAADAKYKGKLVQVKNVEVDKVARTSDGRAYAAPLSALIVARQPPEACYFFFLSDEDAAKIKPGQSYTFTGICRGHTPDNYWRGIASLNWHVDFDACEVSAPTPAPKKK